MNVPFLKKWNLNKPVPELRTSNQFFLLHFSFFILVFCACENDLAQVNRLINKNQVTVETAKDIEMLYSDSAIVRVKVTGPTLLRHLDRSKTQQEFPDGIDVEFYGERGGVSSHMTAKYAIRYEKENKIVVRDSVVWISHDNERLETEELIWEEEEDKVYTNKFVTIFREEEIIYGHGFESNQEFSEWTINAIQGRVKVENMNRE